MGTVTQLPLKHYEEYNTILTKAGQLSSRTFYRALTWYMGNLMQSNTPGFEFHASVTY